MLDEGALGGMRLEGGALHENPSSRPRQIGLPRAPALTLALNAMSFRIISRVKMRVKATLRMSEMWFISSDWL